MFTLWPGEAGCGGRGKRQPPGSLQSLPPALQKLQSKIDSSEQMGNIRGAQERGTPGRGGASPRSWREAPGCCFFLEFCVFQKMKMPKQSYKTCGIYILNVYIE